MCATAAAPPQANIASTSEKYAAVQSLKAYLSDLADCLAAKAPLVEELQDSLEQARESAAAALRQQQQVRNVHGNRYCDSMSCHPSSRCFGTLSAGVTTHCVA